MDFSAQVLLHPSALAPCLACTEISSAAAAGTTGLSPALPSHEPPLDPEMVCFNYLGILGEKGKKEKERRGPTDRGEKTHILVRHAKVASFSLPS